MSLSKFLAAHRWSKDASSLQREGPTNTRIGDSAAKISGGSYKIEADEYATFLNIYRAEVVNARGIDTKDFVKEFLTEKQLEENGPLLVDIDLRFDYSVDNRIYTQDHIADMVQLYTATIRDMFQFSDGDSFPVFIFEKSTVNRVAEKKITKDGIHMIIGIAMDHKVQCIVRERVLAELPNTWADLPITNEWTDVLDEGISRGHTNWQLYGSRKPGYDAYVLTHAYTCKFSDSLTYIETSEIANARAHFESADHFALLSARYPDHIHPFLQPDVLAILAARAATTRGGGGGGQERITGTTRTGPSLFVAEAVSRVSSADELASMLAQFLDGLTVATSELREAYEYTMALPVKYYGHGSYGNWIRVGWALANIHPDLFVVWCTFSAQADRFDYGTIRTELWDRWNKFRFDAPVGKGLTKRSIMHWAKQDAPEKFAEVRSRSLDFYVDETLEKMSVYAGSVHGKGCGDYDLAMVLYQMFKDEFVCVSVKNNIWYQFTGHKWSSNESGTSLRMCISTKMRQLYADKTSAITAAANLAGQDTLDEKNPANIKLRNALDICGRLGRTKEKQNIMTEARELFYDGYFMQKLDANPHLMCFSNGVVDFRTSTFRQGRPEDCLSLCTNHEYIEPTEEHAGIVAEIEDFMHKLFPDPEIHEYMWDHLASALIGVSLNQTFNMYIGVGQNGKSVLMNLMELALGEYKGDVPLTLMTQARVKIGGLAPELVQLKGVRYAVMQEPSKGDRINEGIMKQLTGGDQIQARAPFMVQTLSYLPQFTLVVCSNEFMDIKAFDHGTWRRIRVVDFESLFTETPADNDPVKPFQFKLDKNIKEKFESWKGVFAAMLVARAFKTKGNVQDCAKVLRASNAYRERQDYFAEFMHDCITADPHGFLRKTDLVPAFKEWYNNNHGFKNASPKDITGYMDKTFGANKNGVWTGARLNASNAHEDEYIALAGGARTMEDITLEEI